MKVGILVLFVNSFGQRGLYNSQEIGMAKELSRRGHKVVIYKCVDESKKSQLDVLDNNLTYILQPVKTIGNNAITGFQWLDNELDILICFSDIQLYTRKAYEWARKKGVLFIPYVGITHSTSPSMLKRIIIDSLAINAYRTYKKTGVLAKTNAVKHELQGKGITNVKVAPVGLDFDLLCQDYDVPHEKLLEELRLNEENKYVLLVGRIASDRNPLDVVCVFKQLCEMYENYYLIVIGKGPLKTELEKRLSDQSLEKRVIWIDEVHNSDMWKYYRVAEALLTFSRTEIFGMSIMEAMYYELPVYAIKAPGPNDIILDRETGYLFDTPEDMALKFTEGIDGTVGKKAHERIVDQFSWSTMIDVVEELAIRGYHD